jgi:TPR repeat protein
VPADAAVKQAVGFLQKGEFGKALEIFRPLAESGKAVALAESNLGRMYANGQGVAKDDAQAAVWYRKAADQGDAYAERNLGGMYANGRGIPQDDTQAAVWYRKAADQGDAAAQYNLGLMYANGQGVQQNNAQTVRWFARAAQQINDIVAGPLEVVVDRLPTLRMRSTAPVRAQPDANGTIVKTAAAGEVAYRISQFDTWYEVYFRDHNTVGYVAASQAAPVMP